MQPSTTGAPNPETGGRARRTWMAGAWALPLALATALPFLAVGWVLLAAGLPDYALDGDGALIELCVRNAAEGRQLLGSYSRLGFDHPGPLHFYLCLPAYVASGASATSLNLTTVTLHLASALGALWLATRVGGAAAAAAGAVALLAYTLALGPILITVWDPSMAILPAVLCVVASTAFAAGANGALPVAVLAGSFAIQAHVSLVPAVGAALGTTALLRAVWRPHRERTLRPGVAVGITVAVAFLSTLPPIVEQLTHDPGNLTRIASALGGDGPHPSWSATLGIASEHLARFATLTTGASGAQAAFSIVQVALLAAVALHAGMRRSHFVAALATTALALHIAAVLAVRRVIGEVHPHMLLWAVSTGALSWWAILGHTTNLLFSSGRRRRIGSVVVLALTIALASKAATERLLVDALVFVGDPQHAAATPGIDLVADRVAIALRDAAVSGARIRVLPSSEPGAPPAHLVACTGLALALEKRGIPTAPDPTHAFVFPEGRPELEGPVAELVVFGPAERSHVEELPDVEVVDAITWGVAIQLP